MENIKNKNYFLYLCIVLFIVNNFMICFNKVTGDVIDHFFSHYIMINLTSACTCLFLYLLYHINKSWFDIGTDLKRTKKYIFTLGFFIGVFFVVEILFFYNDIVRLFFPFIIRLILMIGYVLPLIYECYILNNKMYNYYIYGLIIFYIVVIMMMIRHLSPIYICLFLVLLFISFMLSSYQYNKDILKNKWFIVCLVLLFIHLILGMVYINEGNYIVERVYDYITPEVNTGYHYIRELLTDSKFIGQSEYINKIMLDEFDLYGLVGSSILYNFGWLVFFMYLLLHYELIKRLFLLIKEYIYHNNILLVICMLYMFIQLICSITGSIGLPILNISSPFVDIRNDMPIICLIIYMTNILKQTE